MKYKLFIIWTVSWIVLITLLSIILFTTSLPNSPASFFDVLHQKDVSMDFTYEPSLLRILFEPFIGLRNYFILENEGILTIFGAYLLIRIGLKIIKKKSDKELFINSRIFQLLERYMTLFASIFIILIVIFLFTIIIAYAITNSFLVIGFGAMVGVYTIFWILTIVLISCFVCFIITYKYPSGKFEQKVLNLQTKYKNWRANRRFFLFAEKRKSNKIILREGRRIIVFALFFGYIVLMSLFAYYPTNTIKTDLEPDEFLFDFHGHTIRSDGFLTPVEKVEWYRSQGINGAAITDHHGVNGSLAAEKYVQENKINFTVIIAQEYTISEPRIHLNIYGLRENINPHEFVDGINMESSFFGGKYLNVSDMIHYVKENGAYVTVNHYSMSLAEEIYSLEQLRDWGVDGFEIANGGGQRASEIRNFCLTNNLICIGGTDIAEHVDLNTFVKLKLDDPSNRSVDAIFTALRKNQHEVVIINFNEGERSEIALIIPDLQRYFAMLNYTQRASWIIWAILTYSFGSIIYGIARKVINRNNIVL